MSSLKHVRRGLKGRLTILINQVKAHAKTTVVRAHISTYTKALQHLQTSFDTNYEQLEAQCADENEVAQLVTESDPIHTDLLSLETFIGELEDIVRKAEAKEAQEAHIAAEESRILAEAKARAAHPPPVPPTQPVALQQPKLPVLTLPTFSGKYEEWISFRDRFDQAVDKRTNLSGAEKLQYLLTSLDGSAKETVKNIPVEDANYKVAYDRLKELFQHNREILYRHVHTITDQPHINDRSANSLRDLVTITENSLSAIKTLGHNTDDWDPIVVAVVVRKLDNVTHLRFHQSLPNKDTPTLKTLIDFLNKEVIDLASVIERPMHSSNSNRMSQQQSSQAPKFKSLFNPTCDICQQSHYNYRCPKLTEVAEKDRKKVAEKAKLCTNCLKPGHLWKQCQGTGTCKTCRQKHHTLLHNAFASSKPSTEKYSTTVTLTEGSKDQVTPFKPTVMVEILSSNGSYIKSRALLDNCSDETFIAESLVRRLGLKRETLTLPRAIEALQHTPVATIREVVDFDVVSTYHPNFSMNVRAFIIKDIGGPYPKTEVDPSFLSHIPSAGLADPTFNKPGKVEILFSTHFHYMVIRPGIFRGKEEMPIAQESSLGWLVGGGRAKSTQTTLYNALTCTLEAQLENFWKVEELSPGVTHTSEESLCEAHYSKTTTRLADGCYQVELPFKDDVPPLGNSKHMAVKRFYNTELRLKRNPSLRQQYSQAISDLIADGHLELVRPHNINVPDDQCYYLPHHAVFKQNSSTTKIRIVFDASAKSSTTVSLNDRLMIGPVLQEDLHSLLLRWRYWTVPLVADIRQMYLQIKVHSKHHDFLRLVWRDSPNKQLLVYRLNKVTFGTASAPFQAIRTLHQLAHDHQQDYPIAAEVLRRDFYVDDCLTGTNSVEEAIQLYQQLTSITNKGRFSLRKWSSSCPTTLSSIPEDMRESTSLTLDKDETTKTLGLIWNPAEDNFRFKINLSPTSPTTKRTILSEISKVFDPLGFLSPVTIRAKILMQKLWQCKTGWDAAPPKEILTLWRSYLEELSDLEVTRIPRCVNFPEVTTYQLHGFADASEKAYGAVVYLRCLTSSCFQVRLLTSKTRVAPLKSLTVPKLELSAAVLLAHLIENVKQSLPITIECIRAWSDSTITLAWVKSDPNKWKTFIRNRVIAIQTILHQDCWSHIPGILNPADLPSRGIAVNEFKSSQLWFQGPSFLHSLNPSPNPVSCFQRHPEGDAYTPSTGSISLSPQQQQLIQQEEKAPTCTVNLTQESKRDRLDVLAAKYSDWSKLKRHTCWWKRFWKFLLGTSVFSGTLSPKELQEAEEAWIYYMQRLGFPKEIQALEKREPLHRKSPILSLTPFTQNGLLRVGGRISQASLSYDRRHPMLLPKHHLTDLIINNLHLRLNHGGTQLTLSLLQRRFWIVRGKRQVKRIINKCKICTIHKASTPDQLMADLPKSRVCPTRPFTHIGVDFAGPVILRDSYSRSPKTHKAYIAVYVCFSTKAVNLELVSSLSTSAFLASFRRLVSRRGLPQTVSSDNGSNFIGAKRELEEFLAFTLSTNFQTSMEKELSNQGVTWKMIPPSAPHMGGLWEAAVKSAKYHLQRTLGKSPLHYEEYDTLLKEIEACLNSRPLCSISNDPNDLQVLTPGHFLIGEPLVALPEPDVTHLKVNRLDRWQHQQYIKQHFWRRWQAEYLQQLQRRSKWKMSKENVNEGDLAVLKEDNLPPQHWKLARVIQVHPSSDDAKKLVRTVTVRTADGTYKRPIVKLVLLPKCDDQDSE